MVLSLRLALLVTFFTTSALAGGRPTRDAVQHLVKERLLTSLDGFLTQFSGTRFANEIRLGDRAAMHRSFDRSLDVVLDRRMDVQGRYDSGSPGTLRVAGSRPAAGDPTLWHEAMHHLIQRVSPQDCLEEEAYMEACERRIAWLAGVKSFERLLEKQVNLDDLVKSWALREKQWRDSGLSGPFEWSNVGGDRTCDSDRTEVTLSPARLRDLDHLIGFEVDPAKIRALYFSPAPAPAGSASRSRASRRRRGEGSAGDPAHAFAVRTEATPAR